MLNVPVYVQLQGKIKRLAHQNSAPQYIQCMTQAHREMAILSGCSLKQDTNCETLVPNPAKAGILCPLD